MAQPKNIPDQIGETVQDALDHQDFSKIQDMVQRSMGAAVRGIGVGLSQAAGASHRVYEDYRRSQAERLAREQERQEIARVSPSRFAEPRSQKASGVVMALLGGIFSGLFGTVALVASVGALAGAGDLFASSAAVLLALAGASLGVAIVGGKRLGMISRFSRYRRTIGASEAFSLTELAGSTGRTAAAVSKDLSKMIERGLFLQAHVDQSADTLFLTDAAYNTFRNDREEQAKEEYRERLRQQASNGRSQERPLTDAEREKLREGREFLEQIRARIPDLGSEEAKKKAEAISLVADNIFNRAEQDPDVIEGLDQMVGYYLPLTIKLLDAYADLVSQPIQSESIGVSRHEIEGTLETLVGAFAKLHDSLFRDMTWDVSTDISVLNAMLAQDGLAEDPFERKAGRNHE
ncbi:hypothetical protein JI75_00325 [Berryella intestinalis]|uniref:5-bromo-4-chloroindolyl phosphate hydrolysis protein n=2 Tax=Berryella intestinalis TaxID=1531429 RepID=A0A0A8B1K8_9ACTN|nr:hypothetical protein JI75_00325 [Berryella intestinalis]